MEVGRKSALELRYDASAFVSEKKRAVRVSTSGMFVAAVVAAGVMIAFLYPAIATDARWLQLLILLMAVAIVQPARDVIVAGSGPSLAIVSAILANRPQRGNGSVHHALSIADVSAVLGSKSVNQVIVAGNLGGQALHQLQDIRGIRPRLVEATEAVGNLLGRIPLQLADDEDLRIAARSHSRFFTIVKRSIDIAFSLGLGLAVLPIVPIVALVIHLDSPGTTFYSQERVGLNGKSFRIHKFRSMRNDAERDGAVWAQIADPRVTRVGRFLRLTRIDELPQLWNVLRGDMTLVGPRPERPEFTALLEKEIPGFALRSAVKPGLTGWAQVSYRYTSSVHETRSKLEYDLFYVKHASLGLDLKILVRTVAVVVKMRGC